jgi:hypothetical protein
LRACYAYSALIALMGLVIAALIAWPLTVIIAMIIATDPAITNVSQPISIR